MANLGPNFYPKLVQMASELNMKPEDILAVMVSESGINPAANEKRYHASGLMQFMPNTLKGLGYKGNWSDFIKLNGEKQLDYAKQYIADKIRYSGAPITSAAQFYVAEFWPVALKLPGIQNGNPNAVIVEENPKVVIDPKTGRRYSKKYYDIGIKIDAASESQAYKTNTLFHGKVPGAITYGDMMRQVEKNKQSPLYTKALENMKNTTGYEPKEHFEYASKPTSTGSSFSQFLAKLKQLLSIFSFASNRSAFLISVGSSDEYCSTLEYAKVLSAALEEYLDAKTEIHADNSNIEIECKISGDKKVIFDAIKELSAAISDAFKSATKDVGGITSFALVTADNKSDYDLLHPKNMDLHYRKFKLKFAKNGGQK